MLKQEIDQFLAGKQIAFVGASRNEAKYSNKVYQKLKESGYNVIPVHPEMESIDGDKCIQNASELPGDVQALMIIASQNVRAKVLKDLSGTNINRIWMFPGKKNSPDVESEVERLKDAGVGVISGFCPFMFLEPVESIHSFHRFVKRMIGRYPK